MTDVQEIERCRKAVCDWLDRGYCYIGQSNARVPADEQTLDDIAVGILANGIIGPNPNSGEHARSDFDIGQGCDGKQSWSGLGQGAPMTSHATSATIIPSESSCRGSCCFSFS